jgi:peptidyl-prolyl cis-trans isomerase A (cyclophilin A)
MSSRHRALAPVLLALLLAGCPAPRPAPSHGTETARVVLLTEIGEIEVEIDVSRAPISSSNFLRYVESGRYDGGRFHRTVRLDNQPGNPVRIEVIQAGVRPDRQGEDFPAIPLERTGITGLSHLDGTISMARDGPDTATSDFFICIGDQPSLDFGGGRNPDGQGFAAFGHVIRGMDVARRIHAAAAVAQSLSPPVTILRAFRAPNRTLQGQGAGFGRDAPEEVDPRPSSPQAVMPDAR